MVLMKKFGVWWYGRTQVDFHNARHFRAEPAQTAKEASIAATRIPTQKVDEANYCPEIALAVKRGVGIEVSGV